MKKITCLLSACLLLLVLASCSEFSTTYYLDAANGNDNQSGLSESNAWKSLSKLRDVKLNPGDRVLLKRGNTFQGELEISGQGTSDNRIYIEAYGEGDKPCIVGNDTSLYAVRILNSDYLTLRNVEIVNTGKERKPHRTGLKIECRNYGVSKNIVIDGVDIRDVNGSLVKEEGGGSGILIVNGGKDVISVFDSLTIENCRIWRCARNAMIWSGYSSRENWHPSKHTVIQFNEVSDHKAPWDAQGFDSDWNCRNTLIQYNYSHDNDGGMVLICNSGESPASFNAGNVGTVVQYNISINDGRRTRPTRVGMFSPLIHLAGPVKNTTIYRNIIHAGMKYIEEMDCSMMTFDSWGGYPDSTFVHENIFQSFEKSTFNFTKSTNNVFVHNYYVGRFTQKPDDRLPQSFPDEYSIPEMLEMVEIAGTYGRFVKSTAIRKFFEQR